MPETIGIRTDNRQGDESDHAVRDADDPIVVDTEPSGEVSAYVPGLPVFVAADPRAKAEQGFRALLAECLKARRPRA